MKAWRGGVSGCYAICVMVMAANRLRDKIQVQNKKTGGARQRVQRRGRSTWAGQHGGHTSGAWHGTEIGRTGQYATSATRESIIVLSLPVQMILGSLTT